MGRLKKPLKVTGIGGLKKPLKATGIGRLKKPLKATEIDELKNFKTKVQRFKEAQYKMNGIDLNVELDLVLYRKMT